MFFKILDKRGSEKLVLTKLIVILLAVFVIIFMFFLIFNKDLVLNKLRDLPGFKTGGDKEIDLSSLSKDELLALGHICSGSGEQVGTMGAEINSNWNSFFTEKGYRDLYVYDKSSGKYEKTEIYVDVSKADKYVLRGSSNEEIGYIMNGKLTIIGDIILNFDSKQYDEVRKSVSLEVLNTLNNAYLSGNLMLCKDLQTLQKDSENAEKQKQILLDGQSKSITLIFFKSFIEDSAEIYWSFKENKAFANLNLNNGNLEIKDVDYTSSWMTEENLKKYMALIDIISLNNLLTPRDAGSFSKKIFEMIEKKEVKTDISVKSVRELNNLLYGFDEAPIEE